MYLTVLFLFHLNSSSTGPVFNYSYTNRSDLFQQISRPNRFRYSCGLERADTSGVTHSCEAFGVVTSLLVTGVRRDVKGVVPDPDLGCPLGNVLCRFVIVHLSQGNRLGK